MFVIIWLKKEFKKVFLGFCGINILIVKDFFIISFLVFVFGI